VRGGEFSHQSWPGLERSLAVEGREADAWPVEGDDPQAALACEVVGQSRLQAAARPPVVKQNGRSIRVSVFIPSQLPAVRGFPELWLAAGWGIAQEIQRLIHASMITPHAVDIKCPICQLRGWRPAD
jgi:hypothetical protein